MEVILIAGIIIFFFGILAITIVVLIFSINLIKLGLRKSNEYEQAYRNYHNQKKQQKGISEQIKKEKVVKLIKQGKITAYRFARGKYLISKKLLIEVIEEKSYRETIPKAIQIINISERITP